MIVALILAISVFQAWRYSLTSIDPDWAMFNLQAFTGSRYGKDFVDCKTPAVHWYYYAIAKIVGANIRRVRFANHFILGGAGVLLYYLTGNPYIALAYTVLINSGWLLAFHGNVTQVPAMLITFALVIDQPQIAGLLFVLAVLFEPKYILSLVVISIFKGWIMGLLLIPIAAWVWGAAPEWWYSSVIIPWRMSKNREDAWYYRWVPGFTSSGLLYLLPWCIFAVVGNPDLVYWLPAVGYALVIGLGKVIRQNHLIGFIPWIAVASVNPVAVVALILVDYISSGFYFGDIWARYYSSLREMNSEAEQVGMELREKKGTLWVNGIHSGIYIHARKPVPFGLAEQTEIREVAWESRKQMRARFSQHPPDWVVMGVGPGVDFISRGYVAYATVGDNKIYKLL